MSTRPRRTRRFLIGAIVGAVAVLVATVAGVVVGLNGADGTKPDASQTSAGSVSVSYRTADGSKSSGTVRFKAARCTRFGAGTSRPSEFVNADTASSKDALKVMLTDSEAYAFVVTFGERAFVTDSGPVMRGDTMTLSEQPGRVVAVKDGSLGELVDGEATISGTITCASWDE